jgi:hypothetical protein
LRQRIDLCLDGDAERFVFAAGAVERKREDDSRRGSGRLVRGRSTQHGDGFVEPAEVAKRRAVLHRELCVPRVIQAEAERSLILRTGVGLESHRVVHACELERRPAVGYRTRIGQLLHGGDTLIALEGVEPAPEIRDGGLPLIDGCCHEAQSGMAGPRKPAAARRPRIGGHGGKRLRLVRSASGPRRRGAAS